VRGIQRAHELSRDASRRRHRNEVQEAVQAENHKDYARQVSGDRGQGSHNVFLSVTIMNHVVNHIEVNIVDGVYF
jgi:hypothetical protein